jgi:hypothetical protein
LATNDQNKCVGRLETIVGHAMATVATKATTSPELFPVPNREERSDDVFACADNPLSRVA